MAAQIRPNRLDVSDRFPMLGFTIRTDGAPQRAEVVLATDPSLFLVQNKAKRTASNFYSSRAAGPLSIPRGEAVYVTPPEVLARFIGAPRLYFGLATAPAAGNGSAVWQVASMPTDASPYISLSDLSDRSMRRVRLLPSARKPVGYGDAPQAGLDWAGDAAKPGAEPVKAGNGAATNGAATNGAAAPAPAHAPYDDGFGPLPPPPASGTTPAATASAKSLGVARAFDASALRVSSDKKPVKAPETHLLSTLERKLLIGVLENLPGLGPAISVLRSAAQDNGVSIGIGPAISAGFVAGGALGAGLIFGSDGELGIYGMSELDLGLITSISAVMQVTVVRGDIDSFNGWSLAAAVSGGEVVVGGAAALFNTNGDFQGVTVQVGVGVGLLPVDIYVGVQKSTAVQLGLTRALDAPDVTVSSDKTPVTAPDTHVLSGWQRSLLVAGLEALPGIGPAVMAMQAAAKLAGVSIGFGPAVGAGFMSGAGLGVGLIFGPNGELGAYGTAEIDVGFITSLSATMQLTVVRGGIESFNGWSNAAAISGGEELVVGAAALFDEKGSFQGITLQAGIGAGLSPVDFYLAAQKTTAVQLGYAKAFGLPRALDAPDIQTSGERVQVSAPRTHLLSTAARWAFDAALSVVPPPLGTLIQTLRLASQNYGLTIGIGPAVGGGFLTGAGLGAGLIFCPNGDLGVYGQSEIDVGLITSLSATLQVTFVTGGIDAFSGWTNALACSVGEGEVVGAALLFDDTPSFVGITYQAGIGAGLSPVDIYLAAQKSKSVQLGLAQGLAQRGLPSRRLARTRSFGFDPLAVEVKYRMFIPSPAIDAPTSVFGGDGRGFSYDQGSSRGEITATVHLTSGGGIGSIDIIDRHWGLSTEYNSSDAFHPDGKPSWWLEKKPGASPINSDTLKVSDSNLNIVPGVDTSTQGILSVIEGSAAVTISAAGALPLSSVAPDINADVVVFFRLTPTGIEVKAAGAHDGFPCHELYVEGQRIYSYDPVSAGNGPTALLPPEDIDVSTDWTQVKTMIMVHAEAAALRGVATRSLGGESYSINWDDVQMIPQPTPKACWAAVGAMVVGWRDQMSVTPDSVAASCGRPLESVLPWTKEKEFADALGLIAENPQCYTEQGFRHLLEAYGPLWLSCDMSPNPGIKDGHAVVVTGMYNDGSGAFVRITDPADRPVGTPGAPGYPYTGESTGTRYIMTFEDLMRDYEVYGGNTPPGTLQIIHSRGVGLRQPNRADGISAGYAQGLARSLGGPILPDLAFSETAWKVVAPDGMLYETDENLAADEKLKVWKDLLAKLVTAGTAAKLGDLPAVARDRNWSIAVTAGASSGVALGSSVGSGLLIGPDGQPKSFGRGRLDGQTPLDPVEPKTMAGVNDGRPQITIVKGNSGDFMKWSLAVPFKTSERRLKDGAALLLPDGSFTGATFSLQANGLKAEDVFDAIEVGYGAAPAKFGSFTQSLGYTAPGKKRPAAARSKAFADDPGPAPGTSLSRRQKEAGGVRFDLAQLSGLVPPQTAPAVAVNTPLPGKRVVLADWPYLDGPSGRTHGDIAIDWSYAAGSVGEIVADVVSGESFDGVGLTVTSQIVQAQASQPTVAALTVCVRYVFSRQGEPDQVAVSEITFSGDGREPQRSNRQEPAAAMAR